MREGIEKAMVSMCEVVGWGIIHNVDTGLWFAGPDGTMFQELPF